MAATDYNGSMFFSFDGADGVGKTTQLNLFCGFLRDRGHDVVTCRDPGTTPLGEGVRKMLLADDPQTSIGRCSEMLLYMAARAQLVDEVIAPALDRGQTVVSDRYLLANVVYQGHAGGLDVDLIREVGRVATRNVVPDLVFLLDMPEDQAHERIDRPKDRMERQGREFRHRVADGFRTEARRFPDRIVLIAASGTEKQVHADVCRHATRLIDL